MNTPGNSSVYPIFSNGAKRFAFLQGALAATGLYGVKHTGSNGTTPFTVPFTENGTTFGKRSNSYWEVSSPTGTEFQNNAFHFIAGDMDSITDFQLTTVSFATGAATGNHLSSSGRNANFAAGRTALNSSVIGSHHFHIGIADAAPLSVGLLSFEGQKQKEAAALHWELAGDNIILEMDLQRSADGIHFETLSTQNVNAGQVHYHYLDAHPLTGKNYYRLKMTSSSAKQHFSNTELLYFDKESVSVNLFPNPAKEYLEVSFESNNSIAYYIYDMQGMLQLKGTLGRSHRIDISKLQSDSYILRLADGQNTEAGPIKFIKQ